MLLYVPLPVFLPSADTNTIFCKEKHSLPGSFPLNPTSCFNTNTQDLPNSASSKTVSSHTATQQAWLLLAHGFTLMTKETVLWLLRRDFKCGQWKESPLKSSQTSITPATRDEGREEERRSWRGCKLKEREKEADRQRERAEKFLRKEGDCIKEQKTKVTTSRTFTSLKPCTLTHLLQSPHSHSLNTDLVKCNEKQPAL